MRSGIYPMIPRIPTLCRRVSFMRTLLQRWIREISTPQNCFASVS